MVSNHRHFPVATCSHFDLSLSIKLFINDHLNVAIITCQKVRGCYVILCNPFMSKVILMRYTCTAVEWAKMVVLSYKSSCSIAQF